jgi:putative iron-dependent peroxidase
MVRPVLLHCEEGDGSLMTTIDGHPAAEPQPGINMPQTRAAIFLVLEVLPGVENVQRVQQACGNLEKLIRAVGARDAEGSLSCVVAFGSEIWEPLFGPARPSELHPFRELSGGTRLAPSTPGDVLLHIRAERMDLCFELTAQFTGELIGSVKVVDEIHGFRYFDDRDLIGFVDGTENPDGSLRLAATLVGNEDPGFVAGSYVIVQKYLHDLPKWSSQPTEVQERIIGRTKLEDVELDDAVKPSFAHNALTTLVENGEEIKILRHNMPFGNAGGGESGTFFIGYARSARPIEQMLENMFVGRPPGNYDRLLDFSNAVTGTNFFAPSLSLLASLATPPELAETAVAAAQIPAPAAPGRGGSLNIGGLKGVPQHE